MATIFDVAFLNQNAQDIKPAQWRPDVVARCDGYSLRGQINKGVNSKFTP